MTELRYTTGTIGGIVKVLGQLDLSTSSITYSSGICRKRRWTTSQMTEVRLVCEARVLGQLLGTEQMFYGHVLGFKGLERRAVVLAVNESGVRDRSRERLYVGLSRARDQLVVCGDPEFLRGVGGAELAARLGL